MVSHSHRGCQTSQEMSQRHQTESQTVRKGLKYIRKHLKQVRKDLKVGRKTFIYVGKVLKETEESQILQVQLQKSQKKCQSPQHKPQSISVKVSTIQEEFSLP